MRKIKKGTLRWFGHAGRMNHEKECSNKMEWTNKPETPDENMPKPIESNT